MQSVVVMQCFVCKQPCYEVLCMQSILVMQCFVICQESWLLSALQYMLSGRESPRQSWVQCSFCNASVLTRRSDTLLILHVLGVNQQKGYYLWNYITSIQLKGYTMTPYYFTGGCRCGGRAVHAMDEAPDAGGTPPPSPQIRKMYRYYHEIVFVIRSSHM